MDKKLYFKNGISTRMDRVLTNEKYFILPEGEIEFGKKAV